MFQLQLFDSLERVLNGLVYDLNDGRSGGSLDRTRSSSLQACKEEKGILITYDELFGRNREIIHTSTWVPDTGGVEGTKISRDKSRREKYRGRGEEYEKVILQDKLEGTVT